MASSYTLSPMNDEEACAIVSWRYEPPYDFYDMAKDPAGLEELLGPPERRIGYYAVRSNDELVGFFCFGPGGQLPSFDYPDDGSLDVGLGLRPDLTGRGLGLEFLLAGLEFGRRHFAPAGFRLAVATFNERAIQVYERAGFRRVEVFTHHKDDGEYPFLLMTREA